mmetsp:Transcript_27298/g.49070  ORF Transcript_27298/g.49070 Transcript_27298/m.49070 type:complete len:110 (+) Transcript_27298:492-821(+)
MYREHLLETSCEQLAENCVRLQYAIDELKYLLNVLEEENSELESTNEMLAATLLQLQSQAVSVGNVQHFARQQVKARSRRQKSGVVQSEDTREWAKIQELMGDVAKQAP